MRRLGAIRRVMLGMSWTVLCVGLMVLTGCNGFFVDQKSSSSGTGTTGNYVYVANSGTNTIAAFSIGTGTLTALTGSPLALGYSPNSLVVTPNNKFLYVAGPGAIYVYTIATDGTISGASAGAAVAISNDVSLDVSPDGNWLFALNGTSTQLDEFKINTSTGALTSVTPTPYSVATAVVVPRMVKVAPSGALVFIALGTGGDFVFTFNTSTGAVVNSQQLSLGTTTSDNAIAVDSNSAYLYLARSGTGGGVAAYSIGTAGALNAVSGSPFASGTLSYALQLDSTGKYLYAANRTDGTISGYTVGTGGGLTAISGSPYASGLLVTSLARDNSGKYVLAASYGGSSDLTLYSLDSTVAGKLNSTTVAATGISAGAIAVATTH